MSTLPSRIEAQVPVEGQPVITDYAGRLIVVEHATHVVYGGRDPFRLIRVYGRIKDGTETAVAISPEHDPVLWLQFPAPVWFDAIADEMLGVKVEVAA